MKAGGQGSGQGSGDGGRGPSNRVSRQHFHSEMSYKIITLKQRPDLAEQVDRLSEEAWPKFLRQHNTHHWSSLFSTFSDYQLVLYDPQDGVIAVGHTVPLSWDGTIEDLPVEINGVMDRGMQAYQHRQTPTTLSAVAVIVGSMHQRKGLSSVVLGAMKSLAAESGLGALIAPVRPTLKSRYPLTPIEQYVRWKRADGSPFDPWLRVHWNLGAVPLKTMPKSITVVGTVAEWEEWTGMSFPESGSYIVPRALEPVRIDREKDLGSVDDPNLWMRHSMKVET
jgi:hypothetical protein